MVHSSPSCGGPRVPRVQLAFNIYLLAVLGIFLMAIPWTPVWEQASALLAPTALGAWVRSGWARGVVSGLGSLDLIAASQEAGALVRSLRECRGDRAP